MPCKFVMIFTALFVLSIVSPETTYAYVGPGVGISLIGSLIGLSLVILSAVVAVLLWPIRRWLKGRKANGVAQEEFVEGKR